MGGGLLRPKPTNKLTSYSDEICQESGYEHCVLGYDTVLRKRVSPHCAGCNTALLAAR